MIVIGIDVGLTGAVGFVDERSCVVDDIPVVEVDGSRRIDGRALGDLLLQHWRAGEPAMAVFEDVRPRPEGNGGRFGNTMHSQGSMMRSRGAIEAVLDMLRIKHRIVQPQAWKSFYGLLRAEKAQSSECARRLFPGLANDLRLVKHHNRAESLLIANFAQRTMT